jgi:hypothetical protein
VAELWPFDRRRANAISARIPHSTGTFAIGEPLDHYTASLGFQAAFDSGDLKTALTFADTADDNLHRDQLLRVVAPELAKVNLVEGLQVAQSILHMTHREMALEVIADFVLSRLPGRGTGQVEFPASLPPRASGVARCCRTHICAPRRSAARG